MQRLKLSQPLMRLPWQRTCTSLRRRQVADVSALNACTRKQVDKAVDELTAGRYIAAVAAATMFLQVCLLLHLHNLHFHLWVSQKNVVLPELRTNCHQLLE